MLNAFWSLLVPVVIFNHMAGCCYLQISLKEKRRELDELEEKVAVQKEEVDKLRVDVDKLKEIKVRSFEHIVLRIRFTSQAIA